VCYRPIVPQMPRQTTYTLVSPFPASLAPFATNPALTLPNIVEAWRAEPQVAAVQAPPAWARPVLNHDPHNEHRMLLLQEGLSTSVKLEEEQSTNEEAALIAARVPPTMHTESSTASRTSFEGESDTLQTDRNHASPTLSTKKEKQNAQKWFDSLLRHSFLPNSGHFSPPSSVRRSGLPIPKELLPENARRPACCPQTCPEPGILSSNMPLSTNVEDSATPLNMNTQVKQPVLQLSFVYGAFPGGPTTVTQDTIAPVPNLGWMAPPLPGSPSPTKSQHDPQSLTSDVQAPMHQYTPNAGWVAPPSLNASPPPTTSQPSDVPASVQQCKSNAGWMDPQMQQYTIPTRPSTPELYHVTPRQIEHSDIVPGDQLYEVTARHNQPPFAPEHRTATTWDTHFGRNISFLPQGSPNSSPPARQSIPPTFSNTVWPWSVLPSTAGTSMSMPPEYSAPNMPPGFQPSAARPLLPTVSSTPPRPTPPRLNFSPSSGFPPGFLPCSASAAFSLPSSRAPSTTKKSSGTLKWLTKIFQ
jgi:hypothetical protein